MTLTDLLEQFNVVINTHEGLNELRSLILGLAVRGKLVPQDPNDEPTSELLKKIEAEKQRLYKEREIRKPKKLPEVNQDETLFDIPSNWEWAFMPQIVKQDKYAIKRGPFGSSITKSMFVESGYKVYQQMNAINDDFSIGYYYVTKEKYEELKAFGVKPKDLIISCSGTVGKVAEAPDWAESGIINQALLKISLDQRYLINDFFKVIFGEYYMKLESLDELKGTAQKNMVSVKELKSIPFPLPPFEEQRRIVQRIEELFAEVDELESQLEAQNKLDEKLQLAVNAEVQQAPNAEASKTAWNIITSNFETLYHTPESIDNLKKNILNEAVRGRLVPQDPNDEPASELLKKIEAEKQRLYEAGEIRKPKELPPVTKDEIPFEIPESWEWCRLGNIFNIGSSKRVFKDDYVEKGVPFLRSKEIGQLGRGEEITTELFISRKQFEKFKNEYGVPKSGDILIACIGGSIGNTWLVDDREFYFKDGNLVNIESIEEVHSHILLNFLISDIFYDSALGRVSGSAYNALTIIKIKSSIFPLPPMKEQHRIVQRIEELFAICDQLKAQLEQREHVNERLVNGLVQEVLEGV